MCHARFLFISTLVFMLSGCDTRSLGPVRTETRTVALEGAEMARVYVAMDAGELRMGGGAKQLLEAEFRTNVAAPEVTYNASSFRGRLSIQQKGGLRTGSGLENRWDLRFTEEVPLEFDVNLGAGESRLEFGSLDLRGVEVKMGVGDLKLDLDGNYRRDFNVRVRGGVGEAHIRLPRKVGAEVDAKGGIGDIGIRGRGIRKRGDKYVNSVYDDAKVRVRIEVRGGVGSVNLIGEE